MRSQNGWLVLQDDSRYLHEWTVPSQTPVTLRLRRGPAGFVLCHWALRFAERVEPVAGGGDDFGWALRRIADSDQWSNHASGTAEDLNASAHPAGVRGTFTSDQVDLIHRLLTEDYPALRWGGDYHTSVDEMHFEVNDTPEAIGALAATLLDTPRGRRLLEANPTQERWLAA